MDSFAFNPTTGLLDTNAYPTNPTSETAARQQFMDLFNQVKDYINSIESEKQLQNNGYLKMKSGLILQWATITTGTISANSSYTNVITLPITYPSGVFYAGNSLHPRLAFDCYIMSCSPGTTSTIDMSLHNGATEQIFDITVFTIGY